jgi:hypothetical protein
MGEKWVWIELVEDETLRCLSCCESRHKQRMHFYVNVDDEIEEVMCDSCWNKTEKKTQWARDG